MDFEMQYPEIRLLISSYCQMLCQDPSQVSYLSSIARQVVVLLEGVLSDPSFTPSQFELCGWVKLLNYWRLLSKPSSVH